MIRRALLLTALATPALGQTATGRAIRLIVPFAPGGSLDLLGRSLAPRVSAILGQNLVVENRSGAGGNIGIEATARSAPDGHTLMICSEPLTINPTLYQNVRYDPTRDFAPIILLARMTQALIVDPRLPLPDLAGFLGAARSWRSPVTTASAGIGSTGHLTVAMLNRAGVPVTHVPYRGGGPSTAAVVSGECQSAIQSLPSCLNFIRSGAVRAVGVTSAARSRFLPEVPALAEQLPGLSVESWQGILAPAGTPPAVVARLNAVFREALAAPEIQASLARQGFDSAGGAPETLAAQIAAEVALFPPIIRASGMKAE
jgi:tripartite-type tricarboxylate transporter receptor subunit TctC